MIEFIFERYNYWAIIILMMLGLYVTFQAGNMIKKMVGLSVFQTSVFCFTSRWVKFMAVRRPSCLAVITPKSMMITAVMAKGMAKMVMMAMARLMALNCRPQRRMLWGVPMSKALSARTDPRLICIWSKPIQTHCLMFSS